MCHELRLMDPNSVIFLARHSNLEQDNEIHDIYVSVRPEPGEVLSDVTFVACLVAVRIEREHGEPQKMWRDILVSTDSGQVACTVDGSLVLLESIVRCEPRTIRT